MVGYVKFVGPIEYQGATTPYMNVSIGFTNGENITLTLWENDTINFRDDFVGQPIAIIDALVQFQNNVFNLSIGTRGYWLFDLNIVDFIMVQEWVEEQV